MWSSVGTSVRRTRGFTGIRPTTLFSGFSRSFAPALVARPTLQQRWFSSDKDDIEVDLQHSIGQGVASLDNSTLARIERAFSDPRLHKDLLHSLDQAKAKEEEKLIDDSIEKPTVSLGEQQTSFEPPHITSIDDLTVKEVIKIGRHTKITASGRIMSFSALVVVGNEKGSAGIGYGKSLVVNDAVSKAVKDAQKQMITIDRIDERTISHEVTTKYKRSRIFIKPAPQGFGLRCSSFVRKICAAFGIKDITAKTHGSRIDNNLIRAVFKALSQSVSPEVKARQLGKKVFDHNRIWRLNNTIRQY